MKGHLWLCPCEIFADELFSTASVDLLSTSKFSDFGTKCQQWNKLKKVVPLLIKLVKLLLLLLQLKLDNPDASRLVASISQNILDRGSQKYGDLKNLILSWTY